MLGFGSSERSADSHVSDSPTLDTRSQSSWFLDCSERQGLECLEEGGGENVLLFCHLGLSAPGRVGLAGCMLCEDRIRAGESGGGEHKTGHGERQEKWGRPPGTEETPEEGGLCSTLLKGEEFDLSPVAPGAELEGVGGSQQAGDQSSVRRNNLMLRGPEIARTALLFTSL